MCVPHSSVRLCENSIVKTKRKVWVICGNNAGKNRDIEGRFATKYSIVFFVFRKKLLYQFAKSTFQLGEKRVLHNLPWANQDNFAKICLTNSQWRSLSAKLRMKCKMFYLGVWGYPAIVVHKNQTKTDSQPSEYVLFMYLYTVVYILILDRNSPWVRSVVLDEPDSAKPAQRSNCTGPPGYIGWTQFQPM